MNTDETRRLVQRFYECRESNDRAGLSEVLADEVVWCLPPSIPFPEQIEGGDAIAAAMTSGEAMASLGIDHKTFDRKIGELIVEGGKAAVLQPLHVRGFDGVPYENLYSWIFFCEEGRIVRMIEFTDTLHQARRFGWS